MNLFDNLQRVAQNVVTQTMGYDATWTPAAGGDTYTARVLLNKPTHELEVGDNDYIKERLSMEYFEGDFPGLYERVEDREPEVVTINGIAYIVYLQGRDYDGKTIKLFLDPKKPL